VPGTTIVEIPVERQEQIVRQLRPARYGHLLAVHILLLCAQGRTPTEIAAVLFCSRSSVYRTVEAFRRGQWDLGGTNEDPAEEAGARKRYLPSLQRSLLAILKCPPRVFGWCRTRWSCATLALELEARRGVKVSPEQVRRRLHHLGYAWKRARHVASDNGPERISKLAQIRSVFEHLHPKDVLLFIDELDIHRLPKIGYEWMRQGRQTEVMAPGVNQKSYLAGALDAVTGKLVHVIGPRKDRCLVIELLSALDRQFPTARHLYLVADHDRVHTRLGRLLDSLAADGSRQRHRPPTTLSGHRRWLPTGVGRGTANLSSWQRFAVFPPTAVGGKQILGDVGIGWRWVCRLPSAASQQLNLPSRVHKAKAVAQWLAAHPRFEILWLPRYCPTANPSERACGDVHDKCTRNHKRQRLAELVADVQDHLSVNGPWPYHLSHIYYTPEVDATIAQMAATPQSLAA
jgi:transposase